MATCSSAAQVTADIWKNNKRHVRTAAKVALAAGRVELAAAITAGYVYAETADHMIKFWNSQVGERWARIGPRQLPYNRKVSGSVVSPGQRMFLSPHPAQAGPVTLVFTKVGGKAETEVKVCKYSRSNAHKLVKKFTVGPRARDGRTWEVTIPRNNIAVVLIDPQGAGRKLQYSIKATTARSKNPNNYSKKKTSMPTATRA